MRRLRAAAVSLGTVLAIGGAWYLLAPSALGGQTSYAIVTGTSMTPHVRGGDLVLVRTADHYRTTEVVAYRDRRLGVVVLHRIVATEGGRFVLRGDHNPNADAARPTRRDIIGREWLVIPGAGRLVIVAKQAPVAALLVALLSLLALGGETRRRHRQPTHTDGVASLMPVAAAAVLTVAFAGAVALTGASYLSPRSVAAEQSRAYRESGRFSYAARTTPNLAYPDGQIRTGQEVFLRLVDRLDLHFTYVFTSQLGHAIDGTVQLAGSLTDDGGWEYPLPPTLPAHFRGNTVELTRPLDLAHLRHVIDRFQRLTGSATSSYTLNVRASVRRTTLLNGRRSESRFLQQLALSIDPTRLALGTPPPGAQGAGLAIVRDGSVTAAAPNHLRLGPARLDIAHARIAAPIIAGASILLLTLLLPRVWRELHIDKHARAVRRHRALLVTIDCPPAIRPHGTAMRSLDDLARLAAPSEAPILTYTTSRSNRYLLDLGANQYNYRHETPEVVERLSDEPSRHPETRLMAGNDPCASAG